MIPNNGNDKQGLPLESSILHRISPGPSRVLVGVSQFNDENQQNLRIQQAVNRYNGTVLAPYWRPSAALKCNMFKGKSLKPYSSDDNVPSEDPKQKPEGRYAFPGHFPTVLLGKNQMRPSTKQSIISQLRANPSGLPVSRFLDDSAEKYSDIKPTRSVLEVLQDLSRKRIHGKDDNDESSKRRCKGLGGDLVSDGEVPYQPLFIAKHKSQIFSKKDQMTQTLSDLNLTDVEKASSVRDSKWELRKKLAQKNNEIYASLSSSITGSFFAKRKRVYNATIPDIEEKSIKKKKVEVTKINSECIKKIDQEKKELRKESGPRSPPTKDRLMNIYFDLQNNVNAKGDVLKAMSNDTGHSQFKRQETNSDSNENIAPIVKDDVSKTITSTIQSNNLPDCFNSKPTTESHTIVSTVTPVEESKPVSTSTKVIDSFVQPDKKAFTTPANEAKIEKTGSSGVLITTAVSPVANKNTLSTSFTMPLASEKKSLINSSASFSTSPNTVSPQLPTAKPQVGSSILSSPTTQLPTLFQFGQSNTTSSTLNKDALNLDKVKTLSPTPNTNFNAGLSVSEIGQATSTFNDIKTGLSPSVASPKSSFSFGDSKSSFATATFKFSPTKHEPSSTLTSTQVNTTLINSSSFEQSLKLPTVTYAPTVETSSHSLPMKKPANTTSTFSFGNLKPTSSSSIAPSLFSSDLKSTLETVPVNSISSTAPTFSFAKSATESGVKSPLFSFVTAATDKKEETVEIKANTTNKLSEGFLFANSINPAPIWNSGSNESKVSNIGNVSKIDEIKPTFGTSIFTSIDQLPKPSPIHPVTDNTTSNNISSVFSRLENAAERHKTSDNNAIPTATDTKIKDGELKSQSVSGTQHIGPIIFGPSKSSNESNLFTGGSLFGSNLTTTTATIGTTQSNPLFSQTNSTNTPSSVFTFKSIDQPSFKFGPSTNSSEPTNIVEPKPFTFGSTSNVPPLSEAKSVVTTTANQTISSSSIFSFGTEKTSAATTSFTFGKSSAPSSAQPFTFGKPSTAPSTQAFTFGKPQEDTVSSIANSSVFPTPISLTTSKTNSSFESIPSNITFSEKTPAFSFGCITTTSSPFGTSSNTASHVTQSVFGATTSANSVFAPTTSAFGNGTSSSQSTFGTSGSIPSTFGNATAFGNTSSPSSAFGSATTFGPPASTTSAFGSTTTFSATTSAPSTSASTPAFGTSTSTPSTFGGATAFGTPTSAPPTFGGATAFGVNTLAPPTFGSATSFGTTSSAPPSFGSSTTFNTTASTSTFGSSTTFGQPNTTLPGSNGQPAFGTSSGTTAFGNSNAASPFASSGNAFGSSSQVPAFGSSGSAFSNSSPAFGNSVPPPNFNGAASSFTINNPEQTFGSGSSLANNNATFGNASATSTPVPFGNPPSTTFGFGTGNTTVNSTAPSFNFGSTSASSSQANTSFNFGSGSAANSSGSSVFNFGASSTTNNPKPFCFGPNSSGFTQTPTPGSSGYSQPPTPGPSGFPSSSTPFNMNPNPSTSFSLPGTFSIGSGSTQPRSRTASRFRRRT